MRMFGPDMTISLTNIELNAQYVIRTDDHPFFLVAKDEKTTSGGFAEVIYSPEGTAAGGCRGALQLRYVRHRRAGDKHRLTDRHLSAQRNLRLMAEYAYDLEGKANRVTTGIVAAF